MSERKLNDKYNPKEFEENLKEMDEKALQKSKKKLMKLCHKNKHHPLTQPKIRQPLPYASFQ